jgi:hypothetical protein
MKFYDKINANMKIEPPKTLEEWEEVRKSILSLMGNPICDHLMFMSLIERLKKVDAKIDELKL